MQKLPRIRATEQLEQMRHDLRQKMLSIFEEVRGDDAAQAELKDAMEELYYATNSAMNRKNYPLDKLLQMVIRCGYDITLAVKPTPPWQDPKQFAIGNLR